MKKIGFGKKLNLYFQYKNVIAKNKKALFDNFYIKVDLVNRLYTVLNIPSSLIGEPYNLKTSDINVISENYIKEYISEISKFLNYIGLSELYKLYKVEKVDKYSYLIIIGYSLFETNKLASTLLYKIIPSVISIIILSYFLFKYKR